MRPARSNAQQQIASLRQLWQGALDDRLQRLDQEAAALQAIEAAFAQLLRACWTRPTPAATPSGPGADALGGRSAARTARGRGDAAAATPTLLLDRPRLQLPAVPLLTVPPPDPVPVAKAPPDPPSPAVQPTPAATPPAPKRWRGRRPRTRVLLRLPRSTPPKPTASSNRACSRGRSNCCTRARRAGRRRVARIRALCTDPHAGQASDGRPARRNRPRRGATSLRASACWSRRAIAFPREREFAALDDRSARCARWRRRRSSPAARVDDEPARRVDVRGCAQMDRVRDAEQRGAFADAGAKELRARCHRARQGSEFAARLDARAGAGRSPRSTPWSPLPVAAARRSWSPPGGPRLQPDRSRAAGGGEKRLSWTTIATASVAKRSPSRSKGQQGSCARHRRAALPPGPERSPPKPQLAKVLRNVRR